jgi:cytochrome c oxidase cbb3-type subunit 3
MVAAATAMGAACDTARPEESAVAGAPAAVDFPVGPMPGPAESPMNIVNPYATDEVALMEGRRLFVRFNCSGCHGGHGGGGMGPSLRDPVWMYGGTDPAIFDSIAEGRAHGMPTWGVMLPREQIWKLTAYVQSLGSAREPAAPLADEATSPEITAAPRGEP